MGLPPREFSLSAACRPPTLDKGVEMARSKKSGANHYAGTPYTQIPDGLWVSPEFNAMSTHSRCLFMVMLARWDPFHPDKPFVLPYDEARKITGFGRHTIFLSIQELMKEGFIEIPQRGSYPRNATLYRLKPEWIEKKYPKVQKGLPEYLKQFIENRDNGGR